MMGSLKECIDNYPDIDTIPVRECLDCKLRIRDSRGDVECSVGNDIVKRHEDKIQVKIP